MTTEKKYQVFVSSTYSDLQGARQELMLSLLTLGLIPTGMELYPTESNGQWKMIQKVIDECDYYVVLVGGRYGTLSPIGLSYTHREYVYAVTKKKPVIAFMHDHPELLPAEHRENTPEGQVRFRDFCTLLKKGTFRYWSNPQDLAQAVKKNMPVFIKQHHATGWVRAGQVASLESARDTQELKKRIEELEREIDELTTAQRPPVATLAKGSDVFTVQYSCNVYVKGDCKVTKAETRLTWHQLFACMAPQMINPVSETVLRKSLEEMLSENALADVQPIFPKAHAVRNVVISTASFNQIKIHLRALGWTRKAMQNGQNGEVQWQLTPSGNQTMTQLLAVQRS